MFKESFIITEYIGSTVDEQFKFIKIFTVLHYRHRNVNHFKSKKGVLYR